MQQMTFDDLLKQRVGKMLFDALSIDQIIAACNGAEIKLEVNK